MVEMYVWQHGYFFFQQALAAAPRPRRASWARSMRNNATFWSTKRRFRYFKSIYKHRNRHNKQQPILGEGGCSFQVHVASGVNFDRGFYSRRSSIEGQYASHCNKIVVSNDLKEKQLITWKTSWGKRTGHSDIIQLYEWNWKIVDKH